MMMVAWICCTETKLSVLGCILTRCSHYTAGRTTDRTTGCTTGCTLGCKVYTDLDIHFYLETLWGRLIE